jgi:DNA-binding protein H-NS
MAKINLASMSVKELKDLHAEIPAIIAAKSAEQKAALKAKMAELAADAGFDLGELIGGSKGRRSPKGGSVPVKYRNPENPSETWSGRGRMATWLREKIAKRGVKLEDFAV